MSDQDRTDSDSQAPDEGLELANRLFREFHTRCFWHSPRDLSITAELVPFVIKGLRAHGGQRGFMLAAQLQSRYPPQTEQSQECP